MVTRRHVTKKHASPSCSLRHGVALTPLVASLLACAIISPLCAADLPQGHTVINGSALVQRNGAQMNIANSPNAILNWQSFSIGKDNAVYFQQLNELSQVLNRVVGNDASQILGRLGSNGKVWLINPNGVIFGKDARIDVAGMVASTLNISNTDFLANRYNFNGDNPNAKVLNQGEIRTRFGGRVWLLGEQVGNEGIIHAPGGQIVLAAGKSIEIIDSGVPNVVVKLTAPDSKAINLGSLIAEGGSANIHAGIVNQDGIVSASEVSNQNGRIRLTASRDLTLGANSMTQAGEIALEANNTLKNSGSVSASQISASAGEIVQQGSLSAKGGKITLNAATSFYLDGLVDASDAAGKGGSIALNTGKLEGMAGGTIKSDGKEGGHIRIEGRGMVGFSSTIQAKGEQKGGNIEVTGDRVILLNAQVDASGNQGGSIHLGGGWQGSSDLPHAREVLVGVGSEVKANALTSTGKGGEIALWSTQSSELYGSLQAKDGGHIEFSSQGSLRQTGSIQAGPGGEVLFDPKNLIITDNPPDSLALVRIVTSGSTPSAQPSLNDRDEFGFSVALDGDRLAVAAATSDTLVSANVGSVYLFTGAQGNYSGLTWRKVLTSNTGAIDMQPLAANGQFGNGLALNGDHLAVGAGGADSVYLFNGVGSDFSGLTWKRTLLATSMPDARSNESFGYALALEGDRLAIGSPGAPSRAGGAGTAQGLVRLFTGVGTDYQGLTLRVTLDSRSGAVNMPNLGRDNFGHAIALTDELLVVGAMTGGGPTNPGEVHLFTGAQSNFSGLTWAGNIARSASATLRIPLTDFDNFGSGVALSGGRLVVGSPLDDGGGPNRGAVYAFSGIGTGASAFNNLVLEKKIFSGANAKSMPALRDGDQFGWRVALDGDHLAVGARTDDTGGPQRGAVHLFTGVGSNFGGLTWEKKVASGTGALSATARPDAPKLQSGDEFGSSVAMDGDRLAIGAASDNTGGPRFGAVHLFTGVGTDFSGLTWRKKLASETGAFSMPALQDPFFGTSVSLQGDLLVVGANQDSSAGVGRGAVHLFNGVGTDFSGLTWRGKLASGTNGLTLPDNALFGRSVSIDGDRLAVGALREGPGAVYLFTGVGTDYSGLTLRTRLTSDTGAIGMPTLDANDGFGRALSLSGDLLAVGAFSDATGGPARGAVHLFTRAGSDFSSLTWDRKLASEIGAKNMPSLLDNGLFGGSVALDNGRLLIGAPADSTGGARRGAVYVFSDIGPDFSNLTWRKKLASGTGAVGMVNLNDGDGFGNSLALSGDRLAVGAGPDPGAVYLFNGASTLAEDTISSATFNNNPGATSYLRPSAITDLLNAGTFVTLQANNDITVSSSVEAINFSGTGGLSLNAGRNITVDSGVRLSTDGGSLTLVAGDPGHDPAFRDAGRSTISLGDGSILDVGNGVLTLAAIDGDIRANGASVSRLDAGRFLFYAQDPRTSDKLFDGFKHYGESYVPDFLPNYADIGDWYFYSVVPVLTVTPGAAQTTYGDNPTGGFNFFTPILNGFIDGDDAQSAGVRGPGLPGVTANWQVNGSRSTSGNLTAGQHDVKYIDGLTDNLGYKFVDDATSTNELSIAQKAVTAGSFVALNKVYDGTRTAVISGGASNDFIPGDIVSLANSSGLFDNKNAGINKVVTVTVGNLDGVDAQNYDLPPSVASATADITRKVLTANYDNVQANNKTYDATRNATFSGNPTLPGVISGDSVAVTFGTLSGTFDTKNAGANKDVTLNPMVVSMSGNDSGNYDPSSGTPPLLHAEIFRKVLTANYDNVQADNKTYDGTRNATLSRNPTLPGVIPGDSVTVTFGPLSGTFDTKNVGINKDVTLNPVTVSTSGTDAGNYTTSSGAPGNPLKASISAAELTYLATPTAQDAGAPIINLTGKLVGFIGTDTQASETSGSITWGTPATTASNPGTYAINGDGVFSQNYKLVQAPSNKTALTLLTTVPKEDTPKQKADRSADEANKAVPNNPPTIPTSGDRVEDRTTSQTTPSSNFGPMVLAFMNQEDLKQMVDLRRAFKKKLFADAIYKLEQDPNLADLRACDSLDEVSTGQCRMTDQQRAEYAASLNKGSLFAGQDGILERTLEKARKVKYAQLPTIQRKVIVLFGIDQYDDKEIPQLDNAVSDALFVGKLFREKLGYEVVTIKNPKKADIVRTLNRLSAEARKPDSVVLYYAGHGYMLEETGLGYWLPSDANIDDPKGWISNKDISTMLSSIGANQVAMISDSCYSGAFAKEQKVDTSKELQPGEVLNKRSVVVLSSGGEEPVADGGRDGHSIFAWHLAQALNNVDSWRSGSTIFEQVQKAVMKEFPQSPRYGAALSAGHQSGGEYLFEFRQLEEEASK